MNHDHSLLIADFFNLFPNQGHISFSVNGKRNQQSSYYDDSVFSVIDDRVDYITMPHNHYAALVIDVDHQSTQAWLERLEFHLPHCMPNFYVANRNNTGAHLFWILSRPVVHRDVSVEHFHTDVLKRLKNALIHSGIQADVSYHHKAMFKNPLSEQWHTVYLHRQPFTLNHIRQAVDEFPFSHRDWTALVREHYEQDLTSQSFFGAVLTRFHQDTLPHILTIVNQLTKPFRDQQQWPSSRKMAELLSDHFSESCLMARYDDYFDSKHDRLKTIILRSHCKWIRQSFFQQFDIRKHQAFCQHVQQQLAHKFFRNYDHVESQSQNFDATLFTSGLGLAIATQLHLSYREFTTQYHIANNTLATHRHHLKEFGAVFIRSDQFKKLSDNEQQHLIRINQYAFYSYMTHSFLNHLPDHWNTLNSDDYLFQLPVFTEMMKVIDEHTSMIKNPLYKSTWNYNQSLRKQWFDFKEGFKKIQASSSMEKLPLLYRVEQPVNQTYKVEIAQVGLDHHYPLSLLSTRLNL